MRRETTLVWGVPHDIQGPLLEEEIVRINALGPFLVDDPIVHEAPRWANLVDGRFEVMSHASDYHNAVAFELAALLKGLVSDRGIASAPSAVRTSEDRTLRGPDVAVRLGMTLADLRHEKWVRKVPELVVEVLSPSTAHVDRGPKKAEYEAIGVAEYYLLDPQTGAVEAFRLVDAAYEPLERQADGFASGVLGTTWDPASVLPEDQ